MNIPPRQLTDRIVTCCAFLAYGFIGLSLLVNAQLDTTRSGISDLNEKKYSSDVATTLEQWRLSVDSFPSEEQSKRELRNQILKNIPNATDRLRQFHKLVTEGPIEQRTENGILFMTIWHDLAKPEERALFISEVVSDSSEPVELKISETYLRNDVIDIAKRRALSKSGELDMLAVESYQNASHYASDKINFTTRLASLLFSVAPEATLRDVTASSNNQEILALLERSQKIRLELERNRDAKRWDELQMVLLQLASYDDLAVIAYLARVIAWGDMLFPQLKFNDEILEIVKLQESDLITYLLRSNRSGDLLDIPKDQLSKVVRRASVSKRQIENPQNQVPQTRGALETSVDRDNRSDDSLASSESTKGKNFKKWFLVSAFLLLLATSSVFLMRLYRSRKS